MVFSTTGFDAPKVDHLLICRPTSSIVLYEQMIGRGLRGKLFGGTETCKIVDFSTNIKIHGKPLAYARFIKEWELEKKSVSKLKPGAQKLFDYLIEHNSLLVKNFQQLFSTKQTLIRLINEYSMHFELVGDEVRLKKQVEAEASNHVEMRKHITSELENFLVGPFKEDEGTWPKSKTNAALFNG